MAVSTFDIVRLLHVLTMAAALGGLATLPLVATRVHGAGDSRFADYGLDLMARIERWLVWPSSLALLGFGLLMVEGPVARFSFTAPGSAWLHIGTTAWTILALALYGLARARRGLVQQASQGATGGDPVQSLWRGWTTAWGIATISLVGGVVAMALKLGA